MQLLGAGVEVALGDVTADDLSVLPSVALPSVSIKHTTAPTSTASPSSAFRVMIPLTSAGSSRVALSEIDFSKLAWSFFYIITIGNQPLCNFNFCY